MIYALLWIFCLYGDEGEGREDAMSLTFSRPDVVLVFRTEHKTSYSSLNYKFSSPLNFLCKKVQKTKSNQNSLSPPRHKKIFSYIPSHHRSFSHNITFKLTHSIFNFFFIGFSHFCWNCFKFIIFLFFSFFIFLFLFLQSSPQHHPIDWLRISHHHVCGKRQSKSARMYEILSAIRCCTESH